MKSLAVLKRVLLATAGVITFLGVARPASAAPFKYFYVITAPPNWAQGNPQPLASWSALTFSGGAATAPEDFVSLSLLNGASGYAYDTFLGEANGFLGADVSIPTAQWVTPAAYYWSTPGVGGPVQGGALLFFNSFANGTFYADELIIGDPASCDGLCELDAFESYLGISLTNTLVDGPGDVTPPEDDDSLVTTPDDYIDYDFTAEGEGTVYTPEGPTAIYLLLGTFVIGAGAFLRWRRRPLLPAA